MSTDSTTSTIPSDAPPSDEIVLRAEKVGIRYRHFKHRDGWVLSGLNFDLKKGEVLGVVGRNGAGKSSLLRALAGITTADAGHIYRHPMSRASLLTINMGFIPHLPSRENAILMGMLLGLRRREIEDRYPDIMAFCNLDIPEDQKVGTFSSGMRARLALGIALAAAPEVILIDELLGVGDGQFRETSAAAIRNLIRTDRSVVLVTHNNKTLGNISDRVLWLEQGRQQELGPAKAVLEHYDEYLKLEGARPNGVTS